MTRNQSLGFRLALFFAGAGILILGFFLFKGNREELSNKEIFTWISIGLMYLVFSFPFLFTLLNTSNFSGKIPSLIMIWKGITLYIVGSLIVIVLLVFLPILPLNIAIIIQAILLFLFAIYLFVGFFASSHVRSVAAEEAGKQQYINQIKPKAQVLLLAVNRLPSEYEKAQNTIKKALEDIRYIYPVNNGAGDDLEMRIMQSLNVISEICGGISTGAHTASLDGEAEKLRMLAQERKLLRN